MQETNPADKQPLKVYYNSACPVCRAGIASQQGKMATCAVEWKDVHQDNALVKEVDADLAFVRERLHVVDEQGQLQIGFDAFLAIWRNSPQEKWKATVLGAPLIKQCGRLGYNAFAFLLYKWNRANKRW